MSSPHGDRPAQDGALRLWSRRLAHVLAVFVGWGLFCWGWQRVLAGHPDFRELRLLMLGAAIVVPVVTVYWILHNQGIHRRKGPRRSVPAAELDYRTDFHGHEVEADFDALAQARCVDIVIEAGTKRYVDVTGRLAGSHIPAPSA